MDAKTTEVWTVWLSGECLAVFMLELLGKAGRKGCVPDYMHP